MRSLPRRFDIKVIAIEEAHDIESLNLDKLFSSLHIFEILISNREDKKGKGIAFQSIHDEQPIDKVKPSTDNFNDSIAMLIEQFFKVVKNFNKSSNYGTYSTYKNNFRRKYFDKPIIKLDRSFKCRECEGYGHYQAKWPNYLKREKRSFSATLLDDEYENSIGEGENNQAFTNFLTKNLLESNIEDLLIINQGYTLPYDQLHQ